MRKIAVITTTRADYGLYRSLLRRISIDPEMTLQLIAAGAHLRSEFGDTLGEIEADGFPVADTVDVLSDDDTPGGVAAAIGRGVSAFSDTFRQLQPDMAVILGDRFEMFSAAAAAQPLDVPLAHIHGGELSLGAMDDAFRHAMTKLSHLHFAACEDYARRIRQMGEEDWRVRVSGAPGLDNLDELTPMTRDELEHLTGISLDQPPLLVTYHPVTRGGGDGEAETAALLAAIDAAGLPAVITAPGADAGGRALMAKLKDFAGSRDAVCFTESLGTRAYYGMMALAAVMAGNSSSGIIEAASFRLPVVNVGPRQDGRKRAENVIDASRPEDIAPALACALSDDFQATLSGLRNPFRAGRPAAEIIHETLSQAPIDERLLQKRFQDRWPEK